MGSSVKGSVGENIRRECGFKYKKEKWVKL